MSFIPMVSSSPPPMDNADGGWGDDDDFGDFASVHPVSHQNGDGFADFAAFETPPVTPDNATKQSVLELEAPNQQVTNSDSINISDDVGAVWADFHGNDMGVDATEVNSDNQSQDFTLQSDDPSQLSDHVDSELNSPDKELSTHDNEDKKSESNIGFPNSTDILHSASQESLSDSGISSHDVSPAVKPDVQIEQTDQSKPAINQLHVDETEPSQSESEICDNNDVVNTESPSNEIFSSQMNASQEGAKVKDFHINDVSPVPMTFKPVSITDDDITNEDNDFGDFADFNDEDMSSSAFKDISLEADQGSLGETDDKSDIPDSGSENDVLGKETDLGSKCSNSESHRDAFSETQRECASELKEPVETEQSEIESTDGNVPGISQHSTSLCESDNIESYLCDTVQSQSQDTESNDGDTQALSSDLNNSESIETCLQNEVVSGQSSDKLNNGGSDSFSYDSPHENAIVECDSLKDISDDSEQNLDTESDELQSSESVINEITEVETNRNEAAISSECPTEHTENDQTIEEPTKGSECDDIEPLSENKTDDDDFGGFADFESDNVQSKQAEDTKSPECIATNINEAEISGECLTEDTENDQAIEKPTKGSECGDETRSIPENKTDDEGDDDFGRFADFQSDNVKSENAEDSKSTEVIETAEENAAGSESVEKKDDWSSFDEVKTSTETDAEGDKEGEKEENPGGDETQDDWSAFDSGAAPVEDEGSEWAAFPSPAKVEGEAQETGDDDNWAAFGAETPQDNDGGDDDWNNFGVSDQNADFKPRPSTISDDEEDDFGEFGDAATTDDAFGGFETHSEVSPTKSVSVDIVLSGCFPDSQSDLNGNLDCELNFLANVIEIENCVKQEIVNKASGKMRESKSVISVERNVWNNLKDMERTLALKHQWADSDSYKTLLKAINVDTRNMLVGHKKPAVPIFVSPNVGMLEPTTPKGGATVPLEPTPALVPTPVTVAATTKTGILDVNGPASSGNTQQEIPPVDFDWKDSGLTNPLDAAKKEQEFLKELEPSPSKQVPQPLHDPATAPLHNLIAGIGTQKTKKAPLSKEAEGVLVELPDFSFMRARVLMFPIRADNGVGDTDAGGGDGGGGGEEGVNVT